MSDGTAVWMATGKSRISSRAKRPSTRESGAVRSILATAPYRDTDEVTVQVHRLDLTRDKDVVAQDVAVLAVWVPTRIARGWLDQDQPPQVP